MLLVGAMLHGVNNWAAMAQNSGLSMLVLTVERLRLFECCLIARFETSIDWRK
jgi:hypothetical protein